ncbi:phenylalanine--tRNA ligase subunit alpha [Membranicola marinus]|uniref:Phenylalanine--tRNA ligase alpha subunit n=1 Tax=Membranihabitans marinus TaxID=1227546 RepID=A0A953L860_9BACT|nr:phenylalanine--tRNA ligase subunit alpha [Membranihabitans marinus]MBY5959457.1 phenylalanine--tRNA ligase subunit alpha [Membranihabitans marinus]
MDAIAQLKAYKLEIDQAEPASTDELEQFRIRFLGSKNVLKPLFSEIKNIPADQRREFGQQINAIKLLAEERYDNLQSQLNAANQDVRNNQMDLSRPGYPMHLGSRHPVNLVMNKIIDIFSRIGFSVAVNREIEDEWHNFTALNTPENHPARDMTDTYYIKNDWTHILRSQTSTVQVHVMEEQKPPIRVISPGRVYRNETVSARSHCQFHQVEGLYIDENVSFVDLKETLLYFAREMYGEDTRIRLRPSYFPFTEPSAEMDVYWGLETEVDHRITKGTGWLEIMGCGMVDPNVLENCGIDPNRYSGFAFGMGIERQAMRMFGIHDIRMFFENDMRFLQQFKSVAL